MDGSDCGRVLSYLDELESFRIYSCALSLSLDLVEEGIKCTRTGYNHIDSVVECALAIYIGYVFLQLRYMLVGGRSVPPGGGNPVEYGVEY